MTDATCGGTLADSEKRLEAIIDVIQDLAALRFDARASVGLAGDHIDAVAAGVNSLGEELQASYEELERRVADRTAELAVATEELRHQASRDYLTGLPNRVALWAHMEDVLGRDATDSPGVAVLFLDLDDFKLINDTYGHAAGDDLLVKASERIVAELGPHDVAARVGGDEFVVVLGAIDSDLSALAAARRIGKRLSAGFDYEGHSYAITSSVGVAIQAANLADADALVAAADAAMYEAKRAGRGRCVLHSERRPASAAVLNH